MSALRALRSLPDAPPPRLAPTWGVLATEVESLEDRVRTQRSIGVSTALHIALLLLIVLMPRPNHEAEAFTEITLLEPGDPAPGLPAAAPAASAPRTEAGAYATTQQEQRFERRSALADLKPMPTVETAFEDRLQARLATLQNGVVSPAPGIAEAPVAGVLAGVPGPATVGGAGGNGQRIDLRRGGTGTGGGGPALSLTRGAGIGSGTALAPATIAPERAAPAPARESGSTARRTLAGAQLMGPVADRPILAHRTPVYPDWAMKDGVEGSVTLYFIVKADGTIRDGILVQKTAGFEDFDENARQALREWRFQPLTGGRTGEQWGTITFNYRIREGG